MQGCGYSKIMGAGTFGFCPSSGQGLGQPGPAPAAGAAPLAMGIPSPFKEVCELPGSSAMAPRPHWGRKGHTQAAACTPIPGGAEHIAGARRGNVAPL